MYTDLVRSSRHFGALLAILCFAGCAAFSGANAGDDTPGTPDASTSDATIPDAGADADALPMMTDAAHDASGELDGHADVDAMDGGAPNIAPIDCANFAPPPTVAVLYCNDFDTLTEQMSAVAQAMKGAMDTVAASQAHAASTPSSLMILSKAGGAFSTFANGINAWTYSFDVYLDGTLSPDSVFAELNAGARLDLAWDGTSAITVFSGSAMTTVTASPGWSHIVVEEPIGSSSEVYVTINGAPPLTVLLGSQITQLSMEIGVIKGGGSVWFDDVVVTTP